MTLILVEGADGAGKTTLVEQLRDLLEARHPDDSVEVLHKGPPQAHPLAEYEAPLYDHEVSAAAYACHVVADRWHLGELVYPALLDRDTQLDPAVLAHLELFLLSRGAVLVHVTCSEKHLRARVAARGDELVTGDQAARARWQYQAVATRSLLPTWHLDTTAGPVPFAQLELVLADAAAAERDVAPLREFTTYVGPPRPSLLLLGDTRNRKLSDGPAPAFQPYRQSSGHYLLTALREAQLDLRLVGLANACDVDDPIALWRTLGQPRVVALGRNAHARLTEFDLEHQVADHPQWVRRFKTREAAAYVDHLLYDRLPPWKQEPEEQEQPV